MIKQDEAELLRFLKERSADLPDGGLVEGKAAELGMHPNRLHYILEKWTGNGTWNYGVSARCGWFEPEGER